MKTIHYSQVSSIWNVVNDMQMRMEKEGVSPDVADLIITRGIEILLQAGEAEETG